MRRLRDFTTRFYCVHYTTLFQMKTYMSRLPSPTPIKCARGKAKGHEMKGQLSEEKRGCESRIWSGGTANQSSSARGWFCSLVQAEGGKGVSRVSDIYIYIYIYWTKSHSLLSLRRNDEAARKESRSKVSSFRMLAYTDFFLEGIKTRGRLHSRARGYNYFSIIVYWLQRRKHYLN